MPDNFKDIKKPMRINTPDLKTAGIHTQPPEGNIITFSPDIYKINAPGVYIRRLAVIWDDQKTHK